MSERDDTRQDHHADDGGDALVPMWTADGHLDEGTIHTWLDGAFDATASASIDAHVVACSICAANVAEARGFIAGASRLVRSLDVVPSGVVSSDDAARTASRIIAAAASYTPAGLSAVRELRPRRAWYTRTEWRAAAALVVMVGGGAYVWARSPAAVAPASITASSTESSTESSRQGLVASEAPVATNAPTDNARADVATSTAQPREAQRAAQGVQEIRTQRSQAATAGATAPAPAAAPPQVSAEMARERRAESVSANPTTNVAAAKAVASDGRVITGRVVSSTDAPVPGAEVRVVGSTIGVLTDSQGNFVVRTAIDSATLLVRRLGYQSARLAVPTPTSDTAHARVVLKESRLSLSAVVVQSDPGAVRDRADVTARAAAPRTAGPPAAPPAAATPPAAASAAPLAERAFASRRAQCWTLRPNAATRGASMPMGSPPPAILLTTGLGESASVPALWIDWPAAGRETRATFFRDERGDYRGNHRGTGVDAGGEWAVVLSRSGAGWDVSATRTMGPSGNASSSTAHYTLVSAEDAICKR